jgi:hypothetical protein
MIAGANIVGYIFDIPKLTNWGMVGGHVRMAMNTAVCFILTAIGFLVGARALGMLLGSRRNE